MKYEHVKNLPSPQFKRLVGIRYLTFRSMVWVMQTHTPPKLKSGRPAKLSLEDQILVTLQYWREYRTYFHIGETWGVSERYRNRRRRLGLRCNLIAARYNYELGLAG